MKFIKIYIQNKKYILQNNLKNLKNNLIKLKLKNIYQLELLYR